MWNNQKQQKCFSLCQIYKPKNQFKPDFPKWANVQGASG